MIIPQANILAIEAFGGMSPRMSQYLIDDRAASESENVNMLRGVLEPLKANEPIKVAPRTKGLIAYARDKFVTLDRQNDGAVVLGDRLVFTDTDGPMYIDMTDYDDDADPPKKYKFGMPDLLTEWVSGGSAVSLTLSRQSGSESGDIYDYAVSVVNKWGDESAVSRGATEEAGPDATIQASLTAGQVDLLRGVLDGHDLDGMKVRLYRSVLGTYLQVQEVALPAAGTALAFAEDDISEDMPDRGTGRTYVSKVNDAIEVTLPRNARGFIWHPNGFMACYATVTGIDYVYFSSPLSVSHFPVGTRVDPHGGKIVALEEFGNRVLIFFEDGPPKMLDLADPSFVRLYSPEIAHRTVSGSSVSKSARGVIYASRDGIVVTDGVRSRLLEDLFDAESFNRYAPADIRGYATDLDYYVFGPGRENFLLQRLGMMTHLDEEIIDMSQYSDHVYALIGDVIFEMFASRNDILRQARWRSKKFRFPRPTLLKCAKMNADYDRFNVEILTGGLGLLEDMGDVIPGDFRQFSVTQSDPGRLTLRVIKDDHDFEIDNVRTSWPWNLPNVYGSRKSTTFQVEITTNTPVYSIGLAPSIRTFDAVPIPTAASITPGAQ